MKVLVFFLIFFFYLAFMVLALEVVVFSFPSFFFICLHSKDLWPSLWYMKQVTADLFSSFFIGNLLS